MRKILLLATALLTMMQVMATPVDVTTARATAQRFVQERAYSGKLRAPLSGDVKLLHAEMNPTKLDRALYYIFNTSNGYVIVSGDDRAEQILGYGDGVLDMNSLPSNMRAWLATYQVQLEYLQANEGLQPQPSLMASPSFKTASVEPLLPGLWDQEAPYWNQCVIGGYQCLTGCPATSAALVMHYWKYPDFMTDEVPGYRCNVSTGYYSSTTVNVDPLPPVTFDWDNMLDVYTGGYTTAQGNAVATLMRYVGQAEHMEYGTTSAGGSGINVDSVELIVNMYKFFGYDEESVRMVKKTSAYSGGTTLYSDDEWAAIMQEELSEGRPIVFCAVAGGFFGGGHAFNIDGYDANTNKYHINFGWSGSSNNYYALNAFNGGGSVFNQYQQMVIGIQPPIKSPRLKADTQSLSMACYKNQTATSKFNLSGRNLESDVTITLDDPNSVFSVSKSSVAADDDARVNEQIVVTYAPQAEGDYTATVTISAAGVDDIVITLTGQSVYELYRPVMQAVDLESVTATSFRADWSDNTPAENVTSYTLEVKTKPDVQLLTEGNWSELPSMSSNQAGNASQYMPEGWSFTGTNLYLDGGCISPGRNSVITVNTDVMSYNMVSILVKAQNYTRSSITSTIIVATDVEADTISLAKDMDTYLVVLEVGSHPRVTFTTGVYPEIESIKIYGGEITDPEPFSLTASSESGDATVRLIEGITPDKFYTVTGLLPGNAYLYRVKSYYVNGTESAWSNTKEVVLAQGGLRGDVDGDGKVNIDDATALIDMLLNGNATAAGDVDGDGNVNIDDATALIDFLLNGVWND